MSKIFKAVRNAQQEWPGVATTESEQERLSRTAEALLSAAGTSSPVLPEDPRSVPESPPRKASGDPGDSDQRSQPKSRAKRGHPSWTRRVIWLTVAAAALVFVFIGHMSLRVGGPFNILPIENADVRATVEGIIESIHVDEGTPVTRGAVIARLYDKDLQTELHKTEASIVQTEATLNKLQAGPTEDEIEVARATVAKTEDALKYAEIRLSMIKKVYDEKLLSRKEYEDAVAVETAAKNDLAVAKDQLKVLVSGTRPEDIAATRAQVRGLETQRANLVEQLRYVNVLSPADGIIATPSRQLREMRGQLAKKGDLIAKVYNLKTVTAQILVSEKEIADVRVGEKVALRARAYPDKTFFGTVVSIATSAQTSSGSSTAAELIPTASPSSSPNASKFILVNTEIENDALLLKPEMTGQAKIDCGRRRVLELISRRLARTFKVELWPSW
jgi:multidrug resistance efflux pump